MLRNTGQKVLEFVGAFLFSLLGLLLYWLLRCCAILCGIPSGFISNMGSILIGVLISASIGAVVGILVVNKFLLRSNKPRLLAIFLILIMTFIGQCFGIVLLGLIGTSLDRIIGFVTFLLIVAVSSLASYHFVICLMGKTKRTSDQTSSGERSE